MHCAGQHVGGAGPNCSSLAGCLHGLPGLGPWPCCWDLCGCPCCLWGLPGLSSCPCGVRGRLSSFTCGACRWGLPRSTIGAQLLAWWLGRRLCMACRALLLLWLLLAGAACLEPPVDAELSLLTPHQVEDCHPAALSLLLHHGSKGIWPLSLLLTRCRQGVSTSIRGHGHAATVCWQYFASRCGIHRGWSCCSCGK